MERSGTDPMLRRTGVGAYPAQEHRMHAVATCVYANVFYEKKSAIVYVTLNAPWSRRCASRTRRAPRDCTRRTWRKRSKPSLRSAGWTAVDVLLSEAWPLGPCALFNRRGIQCNRWALGFPW